MLNSLHYVYDNIESLSNDIIDNLTCKFDLLADFLNAYYMCVNRFPGG